MATNRMSRPLVVLHDPGDGVASWVASGFEARGRPVCLVTLLDICGPARFDLSVGRAGRVRGRPSPGAVIELANGTILEAESIGGVLNRLTRIPGAFLDEVVAEDRAYVEAEWTAGLVGLLQAWSERGVRVLDPPYPYSLGGRWRSRGEWSLLASRAGFRVPPWRWPELVATPNRPSGDLAFVVGRHVLGPPATREAVRDRCLALAALAGVAILGVELRPTADALWFVGAGGRPDLRLAGSGAIDALVEAVS